MRHLTTIKNLSNQVLIENELIESEIIDLILKSGYISIEGKILAINKTAVSIIGVITMIVEDN